MVLSVAATVTATAPATVAPAAGAVIATVGGTVSAATVTATEALCDRVAGRVERPRRERVRADVGGAPCATRT